MKKTKTIKPDITPMVNGVLIIYLPLMKASGGWQKMIQQEDDYRSDKFFKWFCKRRLETLILTSVQKIDGSDFTIELKLQYLSNKDGVNAKYYQKLHRFSFFAHDPLHSCGNRLPAAFEVDSRHRQTEGYINFRKVFEEIWDKEKLYKRTEKACGYKAFKNFYTKLENHYTVL